ncbi:MAG: TonB-dependent receptor [Crocinitomicaceae bacterium]|nr:TonB-dependent receptor [Crocinitomicaceae bacterium]
MSFKLQGSAGINIKNGTSLFKFSYYNNEQELPGAMILYNPFNDQKLWNDDFNLSATHQHHIHNWKLNLHVFYQSAKLRYYDPDFLNLQGYIDNNYHQQNLGSGFMLNRLVLKSMGLVQFGSDLIYSELKSNSENVPQRLENNSVISFKYARNRIKLESNVTLQAVQDEVSDTDTSITRNFLEISPFLSIGINPLKNSPLHVRSFYKRTFALPTFNDLYYNLIGNTNLKPERAHLFNLGVSYNFKQKNWYTEFSADGFYNLVVDKILAIPTKDLFSWSMQNIGKVNVFGYDLGILLHYSSGNWKYTLNGSYSYNLSLDVSDPESTTYQKQIPYTPFHSATGGLIVARKELVLGTNFIYTGFRYSLNENTWANYLEPFIDWSVSISQNIKAGKHVDIDATVSALNILNKNYQVIRSFPMPGRHYQIKFNLNLK